MATRRSRNPEESGRLPPLPREGSQREAPYPINLLVATSWMFRNLDKLAARF